MEREVRILLEEPQFGGNFNEIMKVPEEAFCLEDLLIEYCNIVHDKLERYRALSLPYAIAYDETINDFVFLLSDAFITHTGIPGDYDDSPEVWEEIVSGRISQFMHNNEVYFKQLADNVVESILALEQFAKSMDTKLIMVTFFKEFYKHKTIAVGGYFDRIGL